MSVRHFLVTGVGRSGTGYTAHLLNALGCVTGHEDIFGPQRLKDAEELIWPESVPGDCSWLGAPYLDALPAGTLVLHQVREPVANVRSSLRIQFFRTPSWYRAFAEFHCPALLSGSEPERCLRYWLEWNRMAEGARSKPQLEYFRYRLEDIDADTLARVCERIGLVRTREQIEEALRIVPRDYNTRGDKSQDREWRWSDLPEGETKSAALALATAYGYRGEESDGSLRIEPLQRAGMTG